MSKLAFIILALLFFSCKNKRYDEDQKIVDRIAFVYKLKQEVSEKTWPTFNDNQYDLPLVYFTDTSTYIANPTKKFLKKFEADLVFQNQRIKIYKTKCRLDSLPFHMETSMALGDPTDDYNYHSPFMLCSSYEETHKTIPDVLSTEEWATMIIHEYFHGYQFKHKPFIDYYEKEIVQIQQDSLIAIYKHNTWFKKSIDEENQLLIKAVNENNSVIAKKIISDFFTLRNERRKYAIAQLKFDVSKYEKCYETMEGTARYIEYSLYALFSRIRKDNKLLKTDTSFKSFRKFRNYNISQDKWLYLTEKTTYFYATGLNLARLLDKLKIDYKSRLFKDGQITMEDILLDKYKSK